MRHDPGQGPQGLDVATSALPAQVKACFKKVIPTGEKHGTVTVLTGSHHVEVTTFRREGEYLDGRRPETVEFHSEIEVDLARRDFTINAMAFDPVSARGWSIHSADRRISARIVWSAARTSAPPRTVEVARAVRLVSS